jgi:hypothetical protein
MKFKQRALGALAGVILSVSLVGTAAADRPYSEGHVITVTGARTEPGQFLNYMTYLQTTYKQVMEEQKKAGILVSYNIYTTTPRGPGDADVYLVQVYKNMAALDGLNERTDAISERLFGDQARQSAATVERGKMRTILGTQMMREAVLK